MPYTKDPFKNNQFRKADGGLDFNNFWPNRNALKEQEQIDPEKKANIELAISLETIIQHLGEPEKKQKKIKPRKVEVIKRGYKNRSHLNNDDRNGILRTNNGHLDLKSILLNIKQMGQYEWERITHSPYNLIDISERLEEGVISDHLSKRGLSKVTSFSFYLEKGVLRINDNKLKNKNVIFDDIFTTYIKTHPKINKNLDVDLRSMIFIHPSNKNKIVYQIFNPENANILKSGLFYRSGNSYRIYETLK